MGVELGDDGVAIGPHVKDLVPHTGHRTEEGVDGVDKRLPAFGLLGVADTQPDVVGHERRQTGDVEGVDRGEDPDVVGIAFPGH
jgi:hypothetical protein